MTSADLSEIWYFVVFFDCRSTVVNEQVLARVCRTGLPVSDVLFWADLDGVRGCHSHTRQSQCHHIAVHISRSNRIKSCISTRPSVKQYLDVFSRRILYIFGSKVRPENCAWWANSVFVQ